MTDTKRNVRFYEIVTNKDDRDVSEVFNIVMEYMFEDIDKESSKKRRRYDIDRKRFFFIDSFNKEDKTFRIILKSATTHFRPPILDSETQDERENDKKLTEGDMNLTHVVGKVEEDRISLVYEYARNTIAVKWLVKLLNERYSSISNDGLTFMHNVQLEEDFFHKIQNFKRVTSLKVLLDRDLVGSEAIQEAMGTRSVRSEVSIEYKAVVQESIEAEVKRLFSEVFSKDGAKINKMVVTGKAVSGVDDSFSTDSIEKKSGVNCSINEETGEVLSHTIFTEMLIKLEE